MKIEKEIPVTDGIIDNCFAWTHLNMNPFIRREDRDNFPSLESALTNTQQENEADHSMCSRESSMFNMSIGARAALTEHMRKVAKYGIDGEQQIPTNDVSMGRNVLDEQWDMIMDGDASQVNLSTGSSSSAVLSHHPRLDVLLLDQEGQEGIEVMTDITNDFFNSSRVMMLATPERNKGPINMVLTRGGTHEETSSEGTESETSSFPNAAPDFKLAASQDSTGKNSSFISLSAADISRISSYASEYVRSPSPFLERHLNIEDETFAQGMDVVTPSNCQEAATPPTWPNDFLPNSPSILGAPNKATPAPYDIRRDRTPKSHNPVKMVPSMGYSPTVSPLATRTIISPAAGLAGFQANHLLKDYRKCGFPDVSAFESMPNDLLQAIDNERSGAPSPISQINLSEIGSESNTGSELSSASRNSKRLKGDHSSTSSSLSDRRRYRTVVPSRVFMASPEDFPDEQDSFCASPRARHRNVQMPKSLIDSFDAVGEP